MRWWFNFRLPYTKRHYGAIQHKLRLRLSELRAADTLANISHQPPPRRHKLKGSLTECWGIDVSNNYRIILKPIGEYKANDLQTIKEVIIIDIDDYH